MDWNAVTSFTTIGEGVGISIGGGAASDVGGGRSPKEGDTLAIAFIDPAFPTLEAQVVSVVSSDEITIELEVDQTRWRMTTSRDGEFGSAKKAAGAASDWIVRGAA